MTEADVRKGMPPVRLSRQEFELRYKSQFVDPAFAPLQRELDAIVGAAWDPYSHSRKAPLTRKAEPGFSDPDMQLISAGRFAELDGYGGYMEPYANSHRALDDSELHEEVMNAARALGNAVRLAQSGRLDDPGTGLAEPNQK